MTLKIYDWNTTKVLLQLKITDAMLIGFGVDENSENFTEDFEQEILSEVFELYNIDSSKVYYSLD